MNTDNVASILPDARALVKEGGDMLNEARQFRVSSVATYEEVGTKLQLIKGLGKRIAETFDPHIKRAFDAHRALVAEKSRAMEPLNAAEATFKTAMLTFQQQQEKERREQQAKLEEEARKEREKLEARAAKAAEKGKEEKAAELMAQAATVATPVLETRVPTVTGISTRSTWKAEVVSKPELIAAVAAGKVPHAALIADTTFLNQQARSLKSELNYPGVKVVEVLGIASRSA